MQTDNPLKSNIEYGCELGWSFTPLAGKRPILNRWQGRPRAPLEQALAWADKGNVGMRTGDASGVVVIDVDPGGDISALNLPGTVTALTGRAGAYHLYYRCDEPLGNSSGKLAPNVDVRADGGQVVFPGSVHSETGEVYRWADGHEPWNAEIAALPASILERLRATERPNRQQGPPTTPSDEISAKAMRYAHTAMKLELHAVCMAGHGSRNETLNKAAFSLGTLIGGGYLDRAEVEQALIAAAKSCGLEADEAAATIRSGIGSGIVHPRKIADPSSDRPDSVSVNRKNTSPRIPAHRFKLDLYGNADRFMHIYGSDVLWCEQRGQWFVWDGRIWQADAVRRVSQMAESAIRAMLAEAADAGDDETVKWAVKSNKSAQARREMLDVVKHRVAVSTDVFDRDQWLLCAGNGVIDLRTGRLLDHSRDRMITHLCPTDFDEQVGSPLWDKFLLEIMAGDEVMVGAIQRLAGYFLTGDISVQILPIFHGPGGNGKNVLLDTLTGLMGPYAAEAPEGLLTARRTDEHPTEIADLCGKRLVVASETDEGRKMRTGLVKRLTGNRYLKARFMRQDYFQFERTHKTVLVTNNRPVVTETSNAIWRRLRLIPFDVTIPEDRQDKHLTDKLIAEWPGILAWAVRGCLEWQRRCCDLELPDSVHQATEAYRNDSNLVGQFIEERCIQIDSVKASRASLYQAYEQWAKQAGEPLLSGKAFASRMRSMGFTEGWTTESGKRTRAWGGLALAGPSQEVPGQWN